MTKPAHEHTPEELGKPVADALHDKGWKHDDQKGWRLHSQNGESFSPIAADHHRAFAIDHAAAVAAQPVDGLEANSVIDAHASANPKLN